MASWNKGNMCKDWDYICLQKALKSHEQLKSLDFFCPSLLVCFFLFFLKSSCCFPLVNIVGGRGLQKLLGLCIHLKKVFLYEFVFLSVFPTTSYRLQGKGLSFTHFGSIT